MIGRLYKVEETEKSIDVLSKGYKIIPLSSVIKDGEIKSGYSFNKVKNFSVTGKTIEKAYYVNGKTYLYLSDKRLYVYAKKWLELFSRVKYEKPPVLFGGRFNGKKALFINNGGTTLIYNGEIGQYLMPCGEEYLFYKNKLCISANDTLLISGESITDVSGYTPFYTGKTAGKIQKIFRCNGYLYALCENTLKKFSVSGEIADFTVKTETAYPIKPDKNSAVVIGESCYYLSCGKLYSVEDGSIKEKGKLLENENYYITDKGISFDGNCLLPLMIDGESFVYVYNVITGEEQLVKNSGYKFAEDLAVKNDGIYNLGAASCERGFIVKDINLDKENAKGITGVSGEFSHSFKIKIDGEFGSREFYLQSGRRKEEFYFPTRVFTLTATSNNENISIKNFRIFFREIKE